MPIRKRCGPAAAAGLSALFLLPALLEPGLAWPDSPAPTELVAGREWTTDVRLTFDGAGDFRPWLAVNSDLQAHLVWLTNRSGANEFWHTALNRFGEEVVGPAYITNKSVVGWGPSFEYGPNMATDSQGNIHAVWDDGAGHIVYGKFDEAGQVVIPEMTVASSNMNYSRNPTLAIGPDDSVVIAHEENYSANFDIVVDKLNSSGGLVWSRKFVSTDVAAYASIARLKVDRWTGEIFVGFGSATGSWVARLDVNGTKTMASVKVRTETDYALLDLATTADRSIHVVWVSYGKVHYSVINGSGSKVLDDITIAPNAIARGVPSVATASGNRTYVVWEDARFGNSEIMLASWESTSYSPYGSMNVPENVRLTSSAGDSGAPQVAVDLYDNVYVAWQDLRDGNPEIYYKFSYACGVEISADPYDLAALYFMAPGEVKARTFRVRNTGFLPQNITVSAFVEAATPAGWMLEINRSLIPMLPSGASAEVNVSLWSPPPDAGWGNASLRFSAAGACSPLAAQDLRWQSFIRYPRELILSANRTFAEGLPGQTVEFGLSLKNNASVYEDWVEISVALASHAADWQASTGLEGTSIEAHATTWFPFTIQVPAGARARASESYRVVACSTADSDVCSAVNLTVEVPPVIHVGLLAVPSELAAPPGGEVMCEISVRFDGNVDGRVAIELEASGAAEGISLSAAEVRLVSGESSSILLTARVPVDAANGTVLLLVLSARVPAYGAREEIQVILTVTIVHHLALAAPSFSPVHPGGTAEGFATVTNAGNMNESVVASMQAAPEGWSLGLGAGRASNVTFELTVGSIMSMEVWVEVPESAPRGVHRLAVAVRSAGGDEQVLSFEINVTGDAPPLQPLVGPPENGGSFLVVMLAAIAIAVAVRVWMTVRR